MLLKWERIGPQTAFDITDMMTVKSEMLFVVNITEIDLGYAWLVRIPLPF
jgi:hypothetical protein